MTDLSPEVKAKAEAEGIYHPTAFERGIHLYCRDNSPKLDMYAMHLNRAFVIAAHAHDVSQIHDMMKRRFVELERGRK